MSPIQINVADVAKEISQSVKAGQRKANESAAKSVVLVMVGGLLGLLVAGGMIRVYTRNLAKSKPVLMVTVQNVVSEAQLRDQKIQDAEWEVAKVFGRDLGCKDANQSLGRLAAEAAVDFGVDPKLVAATIAVESSCNPFATSSKGAIGLMQVHTPTWRKTFDFQNKVNLLNERDNIQTGTNILASYIKKYGKEGGVLHYQGTGTGCTTCDGAYVSKILRLATGASR